MRNYLLFYNNYFLFYPIFTILVAAGAYFYKNAYTKNVETETAILKSLVEKQAQLLEYKIRDNQSTIDIAVKQSPRFSAERKVSDLFEIAYEKHKNRIAVCRMGTTYEPTVDSGILYYEATPKDIEIYTASRNIFLKYYQDSLLQNSVLYKDKKNWICLDTTHEAAMTFFFKNYTKYSPEQQYTWTNSDHLYWQQNYERFTNYIVNDLQTKADVWGQYIYKDQKFAAIMSTNEICSSAEKPFEASISIVGLNNSKYLKYKLNGQPVQAKNGQVFFKTPSGKANDNSQTVVMTATITNPTTEQTTTAMGNKQYIVFK
jgi:hypothetical protein